MSGSRRLSLRARMLVVLIGVTTAFLVINGIVSTVILARNVTSQFEGNLITAADYQPADITSRPQSYPAVEVIRRPGRAGHPGHQAADQGRVHAATGGRGAGPDRAA